MLYCYQITIFGTNGNYKKIKENPLLSTIYYRKDLDNNYFYYKIKLKAKEINQTKIILYNKDSILIIAPLKFNNNILYSIDSVILSKHFEKKENNYVLKSDSLTLKFLISRQYNKMLTILIQEGICTVKFKDKFLSRCYVQYRKNKGSFCWESRIYINRKLVSQVTGLIF